MSAGTSDMAKLEQDRLAALQQYSVLDSLPEKNFDDITELAAFICDVPISLISFVDAGRQWFKSQRGLDISQTARAESFCTHTLATGRTLIVEDTRLDPRFRDNPLVTGTPNIRFYAGAPILEPAGHVLGTVCVIDDKPRTLSPRQVAALEALARQVVVLLDQRSSIAALENAAHASRTAEQVVQQSEAQLKSFVNSLPALAWMANEDGWIFWYNARWYEYTGTTPEQMEGWGWQSVHDPEALPAVMEEWTKSIVTGQPFSMVFPLRGADGVLRSFLTKIIPIRAESGRVIQWFGTNVEIDELESTRVALAKSEAGLNQVLNATSDAVVSIARDWTITYLNPTAEKLYGASQLLLGQSVWDIFPDTISDGSPFAAHFRLAMDVGVAARFEADYGKPLNFTIGLEVYPSRDGIVTFSRDITKLKHATAVVLQNEKLAAVGRLASSIAHEINNPLEAVTNLLYLARNSQSLDEANPYLAAADTELRRVAAITNKTLRFHRQSTRSSSVTFAEMVDGIFTGQHSRLTNTRVQVEQRDRSTRPVLCFEGEIRQVLGNLISNSIDAMQSTGGTLYLRGRDAHDWRTGRPGMAITIADSGTGIPQSTKAKIFDAFYTTKGIGGTGLGLWISKEIVERHRGTLHLRTSQQPGRSGTVFILFLPHDAPPLKADSPV